MSEEVKDIQPAEKTNDTSSYRSIFKATSLFGGVQVYQILMRLIRSKIVAVLLGPLGIGIQGLFHSATDLIKNISSLGLSQSAVRDISKANNSGDIIKKSEVIMVVRKLVWFTGILGLLMVVILSPILSKTSFGDYSYVLAFIFLSVSILFDQLAAGHKVVLQGVRRLKDLAKASAIGLTLGLVVTIPFYYLWGIKGIVPALIANAFITLLVNWFYSRKVEVVFVKLSLKEIINAGGVMIKMGIALCFSSVLVSLCSYIVRSYISHLDGPEMVGLYTAGVAIASTYVGMIFSAMNADFYPRLAAVNDNNKECRRIINEQGEIGALIMGPLVLLCIVFMPIVIRILYSEDFLSSSNYVMLAIIGMIFRLGSWLVSVQFVAKGEARLYAINELIANTYSLALNIIGYRLFGLIGVGASFILGYVIYFVQVYCIAHKRYQFSYTNKFIKVFVIQILFSVAGLCVVLLANGYFKYIIGAVLCVVAIAYALYELNKRIQLLQFFKSKRK